MNTDAMLLMLATMGIVTAFTGYFFFKVLTIKPKE